MNFQIELATPADDAAIRRLLADNPVPGNPPVIYAREPDYFAGCGTMGDFWQVAVARHIPTGDIAGVSCRAVRTLFVNGQPQRVGYLGQLRVDKKYQGRWLVHQGYRFWRALHRDGRCRGYLTTIIAGNSVAERLLVAAHRPSLPRYRLVDRIVVLTMPTNLNLALANSPPFPGSELAASASGAPVATVPAAHVVDFLSAHGPARQFFPVWNKDAVEFVADDNAVGGLWDQSACKQVIVPGHGALRLGYAAFVCVRNHDSGAFNRVIDQLLALAAQRGLSYLVLGLSARDPLLPLAQQRPHVAYETRLYTVTMPGEETFHEQLDDRIAYVELGTL